MFSNPCLGELGYEATTAAILMAGLFVSFLVEHFAHRFAHSRQSVIVQTTVEAGKEPQSSSTNGSMAPQSSINECQKNKADALNALVLESGILFHSLRESHGCSYM